MDSDIGVSGVVHGGEDHITTKLRFGALRGVFPNFMWMPYDLIIRSFVLTCLETVLCPVFSFSISSFTVGRSPLTDMGRGDSCARDYSSVREVHRFAGVGDAAFQASESTMSNAKKPSKIISGHWVDLMCFAFPDYCKQDHPDNLLLY
nr:uncharacterized protein LOC112279322 [Physcomitrium patens]|eukprot:XP_024369430.1 uncharacterized protein LOC112279322 [Physcomitrella patens]